jgi:shikimate dehydrogenase
MIYPQWPAIDSKTGLYGILGNPVRHSLSPLIHNALFQRRQINAVYLGFEVPRESLGLAFEGIRSLGLKGVNITVPFKEEALRFVDEVPEDTDRGVGAVNTVINRDGKLIGYNTDTFGFLQAIKDELSFNPAGRTVLILGAGGAARAAAFVLARGGAEKILIYNRTAGRARGLQEYLSGFFPEAEIEAPETAEALHGEPVDLVVNATSCGMREGEPSPFDLKILREPLAAYDLIYSPMETPLLRQARELGIKSANGLGMLAAQAARSFEIWTGQKEGVQREMLEILKK